jgi:hypothetical protein
MLKPATSNDVTKRAARHAAALRLGSNKQQTLAPGWLAAEAFLFGDVFACQRG